MRKYLHISLGDRSVRIEELHGQAIIPPPPPYITNGYCKDIALSLVSSMIGIVR